jgi:hypothetical protein
MVIDLGHEMTRVTLYFGCGSCCFITAPFFHTQQAIRVDMILTRCLLLMTALAVNTLVAGQPISAQGDKPRQDNQDSLRVPHCVSY